jgi:hypothetical protein
MSGREAVSALCRDSAPAVIDAEVDPAGLVDDYVPIRLTLGECRPGEAIIRLPRSAIAGVERR